MYIHDLAHILLASGYCSFLFYLVHNQRPNDKRHKWTLYNIYIYIPQPNMGNTFLKENMTEASIEPWASGM